MDIDDSKRIRVRIAVSPSSTFLSFRKRFSRWAMGLSAWMCHSATNSLKSCYRNCADCWATTASSGAGTVAHSTLTRMVQGPITRPWWPKFPPSRLAVPKATGIKKENGGGGGNRTGPL